MNAQLQTRLISTTRQKEELLLRCQHLQSLLEESQVTMTRQSKEIQVLKHALEDGVRAQAVLELSHRDHVSHDRHIADLVATITTLREELSTTKKQLEETLTRTSVPTQTLFFDNNRKESHHVSGDQVLELHFPSVIMNKIKNSGSKDAKNSEFQSSLLIKKHSSKEPAEAIEDDMSFISDMNISRSSSMIGSLLDEFYPLLLKELDVGHKIQRIFK